MRTPENIENGGILLVNKPSGCTSHDVVNKVRRLYGTKKVGHTGTLDPMATGLLVVLVGRAVKASEYLLAGEKTYVAGIKFGLTTDSQDTTGKILTESHDLPTKEAFESVVSKFVGDIKQVPPMFSALKVGGKKLCDLAREGVTLELEARDINIKYIKILDFHGDSAVFEVKCSHGTYIRTLCHDIGQALGCGAVMSSLDRSGVDKFALSDSVSVEELENMDESQRLSRLLPVEYAFEEFPIVHLPPFYARLFQNGNEIYQKKIGTSFPLSQKLRVYVEDRFVALAEIREFEQGSAVYGIKRF